METKPCMRRIRINDAKPLRERRLMEGTLAVIEDDIRGFAASRTSEVLVAYTDRIYAMVKLFKSDRRRCHVHLEFVFTKDANVGTQSGILEAVLSYCFTVEFYHKVTVTCGSSDNGFERLLMGFGFVQEAVLKDEIRVKGGFEDAGLFAMMSQDYPYSNYCFVPFERGVAAIFGNQDYIDEIRLYHFGAIPQDAFAANVAGGLGLLDSNGGYVSDENRYIIGESQLAAMPRELAKAYTQLTEYFGNRRASFDLNYRFLHGTPFQISVWKYLCNIPYGTSVSYEDVACALCDNNIRQARKITRAVGAACSENPVAIVVPCHRVIGKDGNLVGYSAGLDIKDYLLLHESFSAVTPLIITKEA